MSNDRAAGDPYTHEVSPSSATPLSVIPRGEFDKERLVSFTDNVISIALTLLVLDVRIPAGVEHLSFNDAAVLLGPRLLSFTLSFAIVGVYWVAHHGMFIGVIRIGRPTLWLNNLFLFAISLLPASAALLGSHPGERVAVVLYGLNIFGVAFSMLLMLLHAKRFHRVRHMKIDAQNFQIGVVRLGAAMFIACTGIALAWVNPRLSYGIYWLAPLAFAVLQFFR